MGCSTHVLTYSVSEKKQSIFCNIFYKTRAILMKFGTWDWLSE